MAGLLVVKLCFLGRTPILGYGVRPTVTFQETPGDYGAAAAVIRKGAALFGFIGRKTGGGGFFRLKLKPEAQPPFR